MCIFQLYRGRTGLNSGTIFVHRHRDLSNRIPRDQSSPRTIDSSVKNFPPPGPRYRRMNNAHSHTRYTREKSKRHPPPQIHGNNTTTQSAFVMPVLHNGPMKEDFS